MKTAIIYYSKHHENTRKVLEALAARFDITLIDALETPNADLSGYDAVGFASGIYYSKFHKSVLEFAEKNLPKMKKVFFIYTCGAKKDGYTKAIRQVVERKGADILGEYGCLGFDSFGPFKLVGGIAKGHPDQSELEEAARFYDEILG